MPDGLRSAADRNRRVMTQRLFIALELPATLREALATVVRVFLEGRGRFSRLSADTMHLTLQFLGDTDEQLIPQITHQLQQIALQSAPFTFTVSHPGVFSRRGQPQVLWWGVDAGLKPLQQLAAAIGRHLSPLLPDLVTGRFKPHLTVARVKKLDDDPADFMADFKQLDLPPEVLEVPVQELVIFRSRLDPAGAVHTPLQRVVLNAHQP